MGTVAKTAPPTIPPTPCCGCDPRPSSSHAPYEEWSIRRSVHPPRRTSPALPPWFRQKGCQLPVRSAAAPAICIASAAPEGLPQDPLFWEQSQYPVRRRNTTASKRSSPNRLEFAPFDPGTTSWALTHASGKGWNTLKYGNTSWDVRPIRHPGRRENRNPTSRPCVPVHPQSPGYKFGESALFDPPTPSTTGSPLS